MNSFFKANLWRWILFSLTLAADQITKTIARAVYSLPNGEPDYSKYTVVIGEWLQFRLVYNYGAAFGMKPQQLLPFLHPTLFFSLFSIVAITILVMYLRRLGPHEGWLKSGVFLILSGAFGNLIDRLSMHRVTDFIDMGIPGIAWRWPTYNIADSCVCVGVAILLIAPLWIKSPQHA